MDKYQTIIIDGNYLNNNFKELKNLNLNLFNTGSLFIFYRSEYDDKGFITENPFSILRECIKSSFFYVNIIIFPLKIDNSSGYKRNIGYLLWFVKDKDNYYFNKDKIREKHIWKDVEWGKRKKNYHPNGKDPGNVWIPTLDDGKGKITQHILLTKEDIINRCIRSTYKKNKKIFLSSNFVDIKKIIHKKDIEFKKTTKIRNSKNDSIKYQKNKKFKSNQSNLKSDIYFSSSEKMPQIKSSSVDVMITSPPYWDLKNYFKKGEIGQESYSDYLKRIESVWRETLRVLKNDGSMFINVNIRSKKNSPIMIPNDIIDQCINLGFYLKDIIIWHKSSGIPTNKKNIVDRFEFVLWFTKSHNPKFYKIQIEDYKNDKLNSGLIWNINRKAGSVGKDYVHPAIYPDELVNRLIKISSNKNDLILDPFLGSGTTVISASNIERNSIGYEFNEGFVDLIKYRITKDVKHNNTSFNFHNNNNKNILKIFRRG